MCCWCIALHQLYMVLVPQIDFLQSPTRHRCSISLWKRIVKGRFKLQVPGGQVPGVQVPGARCTGVRDQVPGAGSRCQVPGSRCQRPGSQGPCVRFEVSMPHQNVKNFRIQNIFHLNGNYKLTNTFFTTLIFSEIYVCNTWYDIIWYIYIYV